MAGADALTGKKRRQLFLDDDPARAGVFLAEHPDAVWVQTAAECIERLAGRWDEVHLDHDLGGEHYVDPDRPDCGMEVVRWLALAPRPHLRRARFTVHSHNMVAACLMSLRIRSLGFAVEARPFGLATPEVEVEAGPPAGLRRHWDRAVGLVRRLRGIAPPAPAGPPGPDVDEAPGHLP